MHLRRGNTPPREMWQNYISRGTAIYPSTPTKMSQLTQTHENSMLLKGSMCEMYEETPYFNLRRKTRKSNTKLIISNERKQKFKQSVTYKYHSEEHNPHGSNAFPSSYKSYPDAIRHHKDKSRYSRYEAQTWTKTMRKELLGVTTFGSFQSTRKHITMSHFRFRQKKRISK